MQQQLTKMHEAEHIQNDEKELARQAALAMAQELIRDAQATVHANRRNWSQ